MADPFAASNNNSPKCISTEPIKRTRFGEYLNDVQCNVEDVALQHDASPKTPLKSIGIAKESKAGSSSRGLITGSVRLFTKKTARDEDAWNSQSRHNNIAPDKHILSYVDGNFASGKIVEIAVDRCYVAAFETAGVNRSSESSPVYTFENVMPLLAVGTAKAVAIYETNLYAFVCEIPRNGMVSAITWIPARHQSAKNGGRRYTLLAVSDLVGFVSLYSIDKSILENQGPSLVHEFSVCDQVRAMDCCVFANIDTTRLLIAVGDKSGNVTLSSLRMWDSNDESETSIEHIDTVLELSYKSAVLGIAISAKKGLLATSTKDGQVHVYNLNQLKNESPTTTQLVWDTIRSGAVRCVFFSLDGSELGFGGYDKTVVFVETEFWTCSRQLNMSGTINTISLDPQNRYLGVGCRDKSFTLFDTSTYVAVKTFHTASWVTSVSWGPAMLDSSGRQPDLVAIRSDNACISILDLTPTGLTDVQLSSQKGDVSSTSWSYDATLFARSLGNLLVVSDPMEGFADIWSYEMKGEVTNVTFCQTHGIPSILAAVDDCGYLVVHQLQFQNTGELCSIDHKSTFVDSNLKALSCSPDGKLIATGGRSKLLYIFLSSDLQPQCEPIKLNGRVWDIEFVPKQVASATGTKLALAVALGDYTTIIFNNKMEQVLQIQRTRTCRCLSFCPDQPLLAIGDGAGSVTIVDYFNEDITKEFDVKGRVNVVRYSLAGDYIVIGSDDARFSIHETSGYKALQEIQSEGFALSASFSPAGTFLALGSANENYKMLRLGPFLAINLIPLTLDGGIEQIPSWALKEALFRSWDGPSFVQRHMIKGESDNLRRVASILRSHPNAIYTFNRKTGEGSFTTAVRQKIPNLLKLAMVTLVDGTLAPKSDDEKNFLTTSIPYQGREILADIVKNYPAEFAVDVFKAITFMKVPFTCPKVVLNGARLEKGSSSYTDPWSDELDGRYLKRSASNMNLGRQSREFITRTPAVLSLPGLGDMDMLASILMFAPLEVFENEAMAVVVRVVWYNHIRKFFLFDCVLYAAYYVSWITLVELTLSSEDNEWMAESLTLNLIALMTATFNTLFAVKEVMQMRLGNREMYLKSWWNVIDVTSIFCVYVHTIGVLIYGNKQAKQVPLAVVTTLLLTSRVLAYLRGFADTGWLISVLVANFRDVRGYLFILMVILVGFSVSFRALFGESSAAFGSLRRSFLSTFQLTLTSQYDTEVIYEAEHHILSAIVFVLAITGVLVIALNALISILADSYARVQQNAVANRRREVAALIVEYMSLLPPPQRKEIERKTEWFHTLLEVDADGSLQVQADDWEGGLNALRHDMHSIADSTKSDTQKAMLEMKNEIDNELAKFKKEVVTILEGLREDIKQVRKAQVHGIKLPDGRHVVKAVQAVQAVGQRVGEHGGAFLKIAEGQAVKSMGQYRSKSISNFTRT